jgi:hypothetical protein
LVSRIVVSPLKRRVVMKSFLVKGFLFLLVACLWMLAGQKALANDYWYSVQGTVTSDAGGPVNGGTVSLHCEFTYVYYDPVTGQRSAWTANNLNPGAVTNQNGAFTFASTVPDTNTNGQGQVGSIASVYAHITKIQNTNGAVMPFISPFDGADGTAISTVTLPNQQVHAP